MARRLGTSISETARLVGCSRFTVVSTYAEWMNDGETSSRRHGVGRLHTIKEKNHWRLSRMVKQNRNQTLAQLTAQYNARPSRIVLVHTVQRTLLHVGLRSKHPTRMPLLTKRYHQLRLHWAQEHRDSSMDQWERVDWSDESRFVIHYADGHIRIRCLPGEQLLPRCTISHKHAGGQYYALKDVLLGISGTRGCGRADHERYRVSEHHCGPVAPLHDLCFSSWKWNAPTGQRPVSEG
ncbi:HTH_Tnp_Tc3_2 domain-containing protein [Trichonephila clavipes]|nr:HTH_Tnp_Tc3_2 domain-containing protein [Trichonephila clavipes]